MVGQRLLSPGGTERQEGLIHLRSTCAACPPERQVIRSHRTLAKSLRCHLCPASRHLAREMDSRRSSPRPPVPLRPESRRQHGTRGEEDPGSVEARNLCGGVEIRPKPHTKHEAVVLPCNTLCERGNIPCELRRVTHR